MTDTAFRMRTVAAGDDPADSFGLFSRDAVYDPYPFYQRLREREPVHWSERAGAWLITRYQDVFDLQGRADLSVDRTETLWSYLPRAGRERFSSVVAHYTRWLLYRDDAYHDRLKALLMRALTPRAVELLRPRIERRVTELLDGLDGREQFDAYLDFAARLPVLVMIDLLGLPSADESLIRHWSDRNSNFLFQPVTPDFEAMGAEQLANLDAQEDYFLPLIRARRERPGADLISAMVQAEVDGERLTDLEVFANCNMMAVAGGGTSRSAISLALLALQRFPDQLAKLVATPGLINLAAEEFLRFEAPTQRGIRTARADFTLGDKHIRTGEVLHVMIGAANRDPAMFADPHCLDLVRNPNRHTTLGHGVHYCLGANLARMELRLAVGGFVKRHPRYRIATDEIVYMDRTASRRLTALPVSVDGR
ncbi:MAG: cytochrome P450 [Burkholderiales bacterium]|nr:cytochrome P450 [Burkholderiales bacterium]